MSTPRKVDGGEPASLQSPLHVIHLKNCVSILPVNCRPAGLAWAYPREGGL